MKKYKKIPHVGSVMTPFPYFVNTDDEIAEVERLMAEHHIHHVPVQQEGRVVGVVSDRDLYNLLHRLFPGSDRARLRARDVIMEDPYIVSFDTPLSDVALEMARRRTGSAIIVHHDKLAGILSVTDICRILAEIFQSEFSPPSADDAA
jgi:acetoin utilization protein AcuB